MATKTIQILTTYQLAVRFARRRAFICTYAPLDVARFLSDAADGLIARGLGAAGIGVMAERRLPCQARRRTG